MTECLLVADVTLPEIEQARGDRGVCVGRPLGTGQVRISTIDAEGHASGEPSTDAGITGEVVISAPHLKRGYFRLYLTDREARRGLPERWHRTGDVGHLDVDGRLWIEGRLPTSSPPPTDPSPRWESSRTSRRSRRPTRRGRRGRPGGATGRGRGRRGRRPAPGTGIPRSHRSGAGSDRAAPRGGAGRADPADRHPSQLQDRPLARSRRGPSACSPARSRRHRESPRHRVVRVPRPGRGPRAAGRGTRGAHAAAASLGRHGAEDRLGSVTDPDAVASALSGIDGSCTSRRRSLSRETPRSSTP